MDSLGFKVAISWVVFIHLHASYDTNVALDTVQSHVLFYSEYFSPRFFLLLSFSF